MIYQSSGHQGSDGFSSLWNHRRTRTEMKYLRIYLQNTDLIGQLRTGCIANLNFYKKAFRKYLN
jgi:hypothetical protein